MATISPTILKHNKKTDGTWNIVYRITHNKQSAYIKTTHFVSKNQLDKNLKLKKGYILDFLADDIKAYREKISSISLIIHRLTAAEIKIRITNSGEEINFLKFCKAHVKTLKDAENNSYRAIQATVFSLEDFFKKGNVSPDEINVKMLNRYEAFLMTSRKIKRVKANGVEFNTTSPGLSDSGLKVHMAYVRLLFNLCKDFYNDEDTGLIRIPHSPFNKYKTKSIATTKKRNLTVDQIISIRDTDFQSKTLNKARDLFMLSFYLCGINAKDIYSGVKITGSRIAYNRSKIKAKRQDKGFISLNIPEEAKPLIRLLIDINKSYSTNISLNGMISKAMHKIGEQLEIDDLTFYHARHSFATIARNDCRFSKDDVAMALNHIDSSRRITDTYIALDWKIIDDVQEGVLKLLREV